MTRIVKAVYPLRLGPFSSMIRETLAQIEADHPQAPHMEIEVAAERGGMLHSILVVASADAPDKADEWAIVLVDEEHYEVGGEV